MIATELALGIYPVAVIFVASFVLTAVGHFVIRRVSEWRACRIEERRRELRYLIDWEELGW